LQHPENMVSYVIYVVLIASFFAYLISIYNKLVALKNNVKKSFANIDVLLQQRNDEVPTLVTVVKGSATHERQLFERIATLRANYAESKGVEQRVQQSNELTAVLQKIFVLAEDYPALTTNDAFLQLQTRLTEIENLIADRREHFNDSVTLHNIEIETFPYNLVAGLFRYKEIPLLARKIKIAEVPNIEL